MLLLEYREQKNMKHITAFTLSLRGFILTFYCYVSAWGPGPAHAFPLLKAVFLVTVIIICAGWTDSRWQLWNVSVFFFLTNKNVASSDSVNAAESETLHSMVLLYQVITGKRVWSWLIPKAEPAALITSALEHKEWFHSIYQEITQGGIWFSPFQWCVSCSQFAVYTFKISTSIVFNMLSVTRPFLLILFRTNTDAIRNTREDPSWGVLNKQMLNSLT